MHVCLRILLLSRKNSVVVNVIIIDVSIIDKKNSVFFDHKNYNIRDEHGWFVVLIISYCK